ncbi:hypothetical protein SLA2020_105010 [Shorea laevis]
MMLSMTLDGEIWAKDVGFQEKKDEETDFRHLTGWKMTLSFVSSGQIIEENSSGAKGENGMKMKEMKRETVEGMEEEEPANPYPNQQFLKSVRKKPKSYPTSTQLDVQWG